MAKPFLFISKSDGTCQKCNATERQFTKNGLVEGEHYEKWYADLDPEAVASAKGLGHEALPVIYVSDEHHWSDFRLQAIRDLVSTIEGGHQ